MCIYIYIYILYIYICVRIYMPRVYTNMYIYTYIHGGERVAGRRLTIMAFLALKHAFRMLGVLFLNEGETTVVWFAFHREARECVFAGQQSIKSLNVSESGVLHGSLVHTCSMLTLLEAVINQYGKMRTISFALHST